MSGTLSVVATPIGNLEDITLRALRALKEAEVIVCEDTRVTKKLLSHFDIAKPLMAFRSAPKEFERVLKELRDGKRLALVSDAGTPGISDPGLELVSRVRVELPDVSIETVPGPSALSAALSVSGLRAARFTFYGFFPLKKGREKLFTEIANSPYAGVFYESPHRILKTLEALSAHLPRHRRVGIFRELTKLHEEHLVGSAAEVLTCVMEHPNSQRGEFVIVVEAESRPC